MSSSRIVGVATLSIALFLTCGLAPAQSDAAFDAGVAAFQRGDKAAAIESFKTVLADNPGNQDAFNLWRSVEQQVMLDMLLERGELGRLAERFLEKARIGRRSLAEDPGGARDVVDRILSGDELERQQAILDLRARYGSWGVVALVAPLGSSDIDDRVHAIQALTHLGDDAVLPLVQVLATDDALTRRNAAAVLGTIGDARAAPALAWLAQGDEDSIVAAMAATSLGRIDVINTDAMHLTHDLASRYFRGDESVLAAYDGTSVVWSWDGSALQGEPILGGLYPYALAEDLARTALAHGGGAAARELLAATHAAMKGEIEAASTLPGLEGDDRLAAARDGLSDLDVDLAMAGGHRAGALGLCLAHGTRNVPAAVALMSAMGGGSDEVSALRGALDDADPAVAFAAAHALANQGQTDGSVVHRLATALSTLPDRLVVSMGETGLHGAANGWQLLASDTVSAGLRRAKTYPTKDVVVVQVGLDDVTVDTVVFGLQNDPRTADVPVILVTADVAQVQALYGDKVAKVVDMASFADVAEVAGDRTDVNQRALDRAAVAATILGSLPSDAVRQAASEAAAALRGGADDAVKVAVLGLVGRAGMVDALGAVEPLMDGGQSDDVRVAAMQAGAQLYARNGGRSETGTKAALLEAVRGSDSRLVTAAAAALGHLADVTDAELDSVLR